MRTLPLKEGYVPRPDEPPCPPYDSFYTHGLDCYHPPEAVVYHLWTRAHRKYSTPPHPRPTPLQPVPGVSLQPAEDNDGNVQPVGGPPLGGEGMGGGSSSSSYTSQGTGPRSREQERLRNRQLSIHRVQSLLGMGAAETSTCSPSSPHSTISPEGGYHVGPVVHESTGPSHGETRDTTPLVRNPLTESPRHGLGAARSLRSFEQFIGVDFSARKVLKPAIPLES